MLACITSQHWDCVVYSVVLGSVSLQHICSFAVRVYLAVEVAFHFAICFLCYRLCQCLIYDSTVLFCWYLWCVGMGVVCLLFLAESRPVTGVGGREENLPSVSLCESASARVHTHTRARSRAYTCTFLEKIIIIIAFKGAIRDFLQSPHSAANRRQHARSSGPSAIVRKSRATHRALITCSMSCYVPLGTKGQLSY